MSTPDNVEQSKVRHKLSYEVGSCQCQCILMMAQAQAISRSTVVAFRVRPSCHNQTSPGPTIMKLDDVDPPSPTSVGGMASPIVNFHTRRTLIRCTFAPHANLVVPPPSPKYCRNSDAQTNELRHHE